MIKKLFFVPVLICLLSTTVFAADFEFGLLTPQDVEMKSFVGDAGAHAVVLNEYGNSFITVGQNSIELIHEYHVRIKFFDDHDFEEFGNVRVPLYKQDSERFEEISAIQGVTFVPDGTGGFTQIPFNDSKVFRVTENKFHNMAKFAMPGLKSGAIIEYKYTITSPFLFNYRTWDFQTSIPKVKSVYKAQIPAIYTYNISLRGALKLSNTDAKLNRDCFVQGGTKCDCSDMTYTMENIPAFQEEDYMTARKNFISAMYFELSEYVSLQNGSKHHVTKEWRDVDYELKTDESFGSQIKRAGLMKDRIKDVITGLPDGLSKAKALYTFIQKNIKWDGFYSAFSTDGIKKALDTHSGAIGDINLALIAALNAAGITTDAVMLSTRDHGIINRLYPNISEFDYVVARTTIGDKTYMLDASDPLLGFGMLPLRCINDHGRLISMVHPSEWIEITEPQRKSESVNFDLVLNADGKLKGMFRRYSFGYGGYEKRRAIKKFNSADEYIEDLTTKYPKIKITKSTIANIDSLDKPLSEEYEVEIKAYDGLDKDKLSFNPYVLGHIVVNPFKMTERTYPVDMGMPSDDRFTLTLQLPDNYEVEDGPKNQGLTMPNGGGSFIAEFNAADKGRFSYSELVKFARPVYDTAEYPYLKEMYNRIIAAERAEITLKRKGK